MKGNCTKKILTVGITTVLMAEPIVLDAGRTYTDFFSADPQAMGAVITGDDYNLKAPSRWAVMEMQEKHFTSASATFAPTGFSPTEIWAVASTETDEG